MPIAFLQGVGLTACSLGYFDIYEIPIDPFDIIASNGWQYITFSFMAHHMKTDADDLFLLAGDASFSFYSHTQSTFILSVSECLAADQLHYYLMHEIGHIFHGHVSPTNTLLLQGTPEQEKQADDFAIHALGLDR